MEPVRLIVIGAGSRGSIYANYAAKYPNDVQILGVAEPREFYRERLASEFAIPRDAVTSDWRALASRPKFADGVIIATSDADHADPAVAFAELGYHVLLEKPMAPSLEDCRRIVEAARASGSIFAVCHVMRYTAYTQELKAILDSGRLGQIVSLSHLEPVGYWHQAHSFVRGNWRNSANSSSMLLAKACHDLDWIRYLIGERCLKVSSFGNLKHFRREERPDGASDRCLDCAVEASCAYSAIKIYLGRAHRGETHWPLDVLTPDLSVAGVTEALRTGSYGRCVYDCDNDVVDHQVVNMLFAGGATAAFTMTGFTYQRDRETRIFGTRGELFGDGSSLVIHDFLTDQSETIRTDQDADGTMRTGHGGGDDALMARFVSAVASNDRDMILSGYDDTLESHMLVFAAETARRQGRVVDL